MVKAEKVLDFDSLTPTTQRELIAKIPGRVVRIPMRDRWPITRHELGALYQGLIDGGATKTDAERTLASVCGRSPRTIRWAISRAAEK